MEHEKLHVLVNFEKLQRRLKEIFPSCSISRYKQEKMTFQKLLG